MKYAWPIAKVRKPDGLVAVWLTHTTWMQISGALHGAYVRARKATGERQARREMKQPDRIFDVWPCDVSDAENALQLYRTGMTAFASVYALMEPKEYVTPNELIAIGDRREKESYQAKLAELQDKQTC